MIDIEKLKALAEAAQTERESNIEMSKRGYGFPGTSHLRALEVAANPAAVLELIAEVERGQRMLVAACVSLGDIGEALGADMDDDADHLIGMIKHLREERDSQQRVCIGVMEERDQLKAELEKLEGAKKLCPCGYETCLLHMWPPRVHSEVAKLKAENEVLRKDAERYKWFRDQHWDSSAICAVAEPKASTKFGAYCPSGDLLDQAIDAAIELEQKPCAS